MIRSVSVTVALSMCALVGCGGGDDLGLDGMSGGDVTMPGGDATVPGDLATIPDGIAPIFTSEDCLEVANLMLMSASIAMGEAGQVEEALGQLEDLESKVPEEIRDDMRIYAEVLTDWYAVWSKWAENPSMAFTDPEVVAASERFADEEVVAALDNIDAYMTANCSG